MKTRITSTRDELMDQLIKCQNHPFYSNVDILTITGFMDDFAVLKHLASCQETINKLKKAA